MGLRRVQGDPELICYLDIGQAQRHEAKNDSLAIAQRLKPVPSAPAGPGT